LKKLNKKYKEQEITEFSLFDFSKEIKKIEDTFHKKNIGKKKYSIIKDLVKYIARE
jgi:hypothetical protein